MKCKSLTTTVAVLSTFASVFLPALARPAIKADLAGKKICWSEGVAGTFYPNGKFVNSIQEEGTWKVAKGVQTVKLTNGAVNSGTLQFNDDKTFDYAGTWDGHPNASHGGYCN